MGDRTSRVIFDGEKARIKLVRFDTCEAVRTGAAAALHFKGKIAVMADDIRLAEVKNGVVSGIEKTNAEPLDMGMGFGALISFFIRKNGLDGGVMLTLKDGICYLYFYDRYGLKVSADSYEKLKTIHSQLPDGVVAVNVSSGRETRCEVSDYTDFLKTDKLRGTSLYFDSPNVYITACAKELFEKCGAVLLTEQTSGCISISTDREGRFLWGKDEKFRPVTKNEVSILLLKILAEKGVKKTAYSYLSPTFCDTLCRMYGIEYFKVYDISSEDDTKARERAFENMIFFDGLMAATEICAYVNEKETTLSEVLSDIPCGVSKVQNIWIPSARKDYVIRKLSGRIGSAARVRVLPCVTGGLKLMVEAYDQESADELCSFYKSEIYRLAENAEE